MDIQGENYEFMENAVKRIANDMIILNKPKLVYQYNLNYYFYANDDYPVIHFLNCLFRDVQQEHIAHVIMNSSTILNFQYSLNNLGYKSQIKYNYETGDIKLIIENNI